MRVRSVAKWSGWWLAFLLAGCVQPAVQQSSGTFGRSGIDLFNAPVAPSEVSTAEEIPQAQGQAVQSQAVQSQAVQSQAVESQADSNPANGDQGEGKPMLSSGQPNWISGSATARSAASESAASESAASQSAAAALAIPESGEAAAATMSSASQISQVTEASATPTGPADRHNKDSRRKERDLRNAFANATASGQPQTALDLAGYLVQQERHGEALFVIDSAIDRQRTVALRIARASLLRDMARSDLAVGELRSVIRDVGIEKISPSTLFDLAQAEWVNGEAGAAAATLRRIQHEYAGDAWLQDHAADMEEWHQRITTAHASRDSLANGVMRDLFALLRAAPDLSGRLKILDSLAGPAAKAGDTSDGRHPIRIKAIAIACADEATAVRVRAVQLAAANGMTDLPFWRAALEDTAPAVRRFAATGAANQHKKIAAPILLTAIEHEQDPQAFGALHTSLARALGLAAPIIDKNSPSDRAAAYAHWKLQCERHGL